MTTVCAISVGDRAGKPFFETITEAHLETFGIERELIKPLNLAWQEVRRVQEEEGFKLKYLDLIASMSLDTETKTMRLPFNQCFRWHMLLTVLDELAQMEAHFKND